MNPQYFFFSKTILDEISYVKSCLSDEIKEQGLSQTVVSDVAIYKTLDLVFCKAYKSVIVKSLGRHGCSKDCYYYTPRNGKFGSCKHHAFLHSHFD